MSREPFDATQLEHLLDCERIAGAVQGDTGYDGLKVDFNFGVRVQVPAGDWHVRILDYNSGIIGFEADELYPLCWTPEMNGIIHS